MSGPISARLLPRTVTITGGRAAVGGVDLATLADEFGTPLYVYDEHELRERCREYRAGFPDGVHYAAKAFLCGAMARLVVEEGLDIDVASGGELHVVRHAGVDASRVVVHGNNKSDDELRIAATAGVKAVVVDSHDELDRLARPEVVGDGRLRVLIRVNPGVEAHTHEYLATGAVDSKFGFPIATGDAMRAVERVAEMRQLEFGGLHCHIGSQIFRREGFDAALDALASLTAQIEVALGLEVDELDLGGGLGIAYTEADDAPPIAQHAAWVHEAFGAAVTNAGVRHRPRVTTEPGRSIAAPAGITLYRVGTIKTIPGVRTYVSVDGGLADNPRPALYGARYEAFVATRADADRDQLVTIAGKHCEQGDLLIRDAEVPGDLAIGDVLAVPATGAYGHSMASNYNQLPRPAVVFVSDGSARVVVRRETLADLVGREV
jgi:diaminopimelate decarboxylase